MINRNLQTATAPTDVIIPSFAITPLTCGVNWYVMVLFETTSGTPVEVASYNPNNSTAVSTSSYIAFTNINLLSFTHNLNTQAATRTFRLAPKVLDTIDVAGLTSANPINFTLNLICTIQSMAVVNPTPQYCHSALKPTYSATPLTTPTVTMVPADCPNVTINWTLV